MDKLAAAIVYSDHIEEIPTIKKIVLMKPIALNDKKPNNLNGNSQNSDNVFVDEKIMVCF